MSMASLQRRVEALEARLRPPPRPAPTPKTPVLFSVSRTLRDGHHFIGWGWYPNAIEVAAIQAGAFVSFTESDVGGAFVGVEGCDPRPLPALRETEPREQTNGATDSDNGGR